MREVNILVIAHPDDESMFFVPTIRSLVRSGRTLWILCLTTGDYDGLGKQRQKEIHRAGKLLGVDKVIVQDELMDHPTERWSVPNVVDAIKKSINENLQEDQDHERVVLITFDEYGVSGHINHIDTFLGVREITKCGKPCWQINDKYIPVEAWQLESERNILKKYFPILSWVLLLLSFFMTYSAMAVQGSRQIYRFNEPWMNWRAMRAHESQFVWYRRLFVVFSCYTYVNVLKPIQATRE